MMFFRSLSMQSKLLAAVLALLLSAIGLVAWLGYATARDSLRTAALQQLQGLQRSKARAVATVLRATRNEILSFSAMPSVGENSRLFLGAYRQLAGAPVSPEMRQAVTQFYRSEFAPAVDQKLGVETPQGAFLPTTNAGWYLQYHYIAQGARPYTGSAALATTAADDSAYGKLVAQLRPTLGETINRLGFDNVLLIDPETLEVFFSYTASTILGTNLESGPYAASNLAAAARSLRQSQNVDDYKLSDFEFYRPSLGAPKAFVSTPVFVGNRIVAIMALRLPLEPFEAALSGDHQWEADGLGKTGETYMTGPDSLMRTDSRFMLEDRAGFLKALHTSKLTSGAVSAVERLGTTVLTVPVKHAGAAAAMNGQSGVIEAEDYRGEPVFVAYGPVDLDTLRWGVMAQIDRAEALQPLRHYARRALAAAVGLGLLASLLALWLARGLTRPIDDLVRGAQRISRGDLDGEVPLANSPEFRLLGSAFNDMTRNLRANRDQMQEQVQETERLLLSLLPASGAAHVREGRHDEPQSFADVTVAYVNLTGIEALLAGPTGDEASLALLSDMVAAFDEAAERLSVEKVRTIGSSYLAASGLSLKRPDHTARMVDFAREVVRIVRRFNSERGLDIVAEIGINTGPVTGGLVGRRRFIYDLWGDTVKLARGIESDGKTSIQVTRAVYERVRDVVAFGSPFRAVVRGMGEVELYPVLDETR